LKIFVGNLALTTTSDQLLETFKAHGDVSSAEIVKDRRTGDSKGFGFVDMPAKAQARAAIQALDLKALNGRAMTVNEARPGQGGREPRRR
jgi:cold-inducible RNA-binding protein